MNHDAFEDERFRISVIASMNQRYHQYRGDHWLRWDRGVRILVGVFAVLGALLAVVTAYDSASEAVVVSVLIAIASVVAAFVLNVIPLGDWTMQHQGLFQRWSDLHERTEDLAFDVGENPEPEHVDRLKELNATLNRICGAELSVRDQELWDRCEREERQSRGMPVPSQPVEGASQTVQPTPAAQA